MNEPFYDGHVIRVNGDIEPDVTCTFQEIGNLIQAPNAVQMINVNTGHYKCILFVHADGAMMGLPVNKFASELLQRMSPREVVELVGDIFIGNKRKRA